MNTISMNSCPSSLLLMLLVFMSLYALIVKIYQINELHPFLLKITNSCIFCKLLQLPGLSVSASEEKRGAGSTRCMLAGLDGWATSLGRIGARKSALVNTFGLLLDGELDGPFKFCEKPPWSRIWKFRRKRKKKVGRWAIWSGDQQKDTLTIGKSFF